MLRLCSVSIAIYSFTATIRSQSTDQSFPTPITTNDINGTINPRDIGDSRITSYYFTFGGSQGDVFLNLFTKNFNGDLDLFIADGLRPLTKIVVYADSGENETGRVVYLRKPERLLLRVAGRTPNDDPATFRIKFAGSFVAAIEGAEIPNAPTVSSISESGIRVNSVGTIVAVVPKAAPSPIEPVAEVVVEPVFTEPVAAQVVDDKPVEPTSIEKPIVAPMMDAELPKKKVEVVITDDLPIGLERPVPAAKAVKKPAKATRLSKTKNTAPKPPMVEPDPMANIKLVILFRNGEKLERPMSEVSRFVVDRGVLTVIAKDGKISRHQMLTVAKVTIE